MVATFVHDEPLWIHHRYSNDTLINNGMTWGQRKHPVCSLPLDATMFKIGSQSTHVSANCEAELTDESSESAIGAKKSRLPLYLSLKY